MKTQAPGRLDCRRRYRRLVLDMHIPDWEPGLLVKFDPERIADLLAAARINYASVYAQSHTGHCYNMTYQEAADLAGALEPRLTIPTHFEMFAMNSVEPALFIDYMRVKYPRLKTLRPEHGRRIDIAEEA